MNVDLIKELLEENGVVGLNLYLVNNEKGKAVTEFEVDKSSENTLLVTKPEKMLINLNYVISIKQIVEH